MPMTKDEAVKWLGEQERIAAIARMPSIAIRIAQTKELLASAIIPTPELREAVEVVYYTSRSIAHMDALTGMDRRSFCDAVALVRAAFKEPEHGG